jgi:hypothetical protein
MTLFPWAERARMRWYSDVKCCHGGPLRLILKHGFYLPKLLHPHRASGAEVDLFYHSHRNSISRLTWK